jgi:transcription elongation factor Elf1
MNKQTPLKPEIKGTKTGYVIQFTCPACAAKSVIITRTPQDHFKETHVAACKHCKVRSTVLTPSENHPRNYSPTFPCAGS